MKVFEILDMEEKIDAVRSLKNWHNAFLILEATQNKKFQKIIKEIRPFATLSHDKEIKVGILDFYMLAKEHGFLKISHPAFYKAFLCVTLLSGQSKSGMNYNSFVKSIMGEQVYGFKKEVNSFSFKEENKKLKTIEISSFFTPLYEQYTRESIRGKEIYDNKPLKLDFIKKYVEDNLHSSSKVTQKSSKTLKSTKTITIREKALLDSLKRKHYPIPSPRETTNIKNNLCHISDEQIKQIQHLQKKVYGEGKSTGADDGFLLDILEKSHMNYMKYKGKITDHCLLSVFKIAPEIFNPANLIRFYEAENVKLFEYKQKF